MLSPPDQSIRPLRGPRETARAQLQNELPSRYKYKYLHHPHTATHVKGTEQQAEDRIVTSGNTQAVRNNCDLPVRAWGVASTEAASCVESGERRRLPSSGRRRPAYHA